MKIIIMTIMFALAFTTNASPLPDYPFIFTEGDASIELKPDLCTITFQITIRDKDATNALQQMTHRSSEALAILADNDVKAEDIIAFEISKRHVRNQSRDSHQFEFLGYEMKRKIEITLKDLQNYSTLMSTLIKTSDIIGLNSEFDRTDREEIESKLLAEAVSAAKTKAKIMAQASEQRIIKLQALSSSDFKTLGEQFGLGGRSESYFGSRMSASGGGPEVIFVPSSIEFLGSVSVIYMVEEIK